MGRHQPDSNKLPILFESEIRHRVRSVQLTHPLHPSLRHSIISMLFSFHRRDAISASIARIRSVSLCMTPSSSVLTIFTAALAPDVPASVLLLAKPFSTSVSRKLTTA